MNQAMRLTLAVLSTVSMVALSGGVVLADASSDFEAIFGAEAKKVAASGIKADDAAFAAKLLNAAKKMPDSPNLQILLCEKACEFGSAGPAGCDTALEALALLERAVPARKAQWRRRKFEIVKFRFDKSYGAAKKAAGRSYLEMLEVLADDKVSEGNAIEAKLLYKRATMVAAYVKSPRLVETVAKSKRVTALAAQESELKSLQAKLNKNPQDTTAREELVLLHVSGFDKPDEAAKLLTRDLGEGIRTYVSLAAKSPADLTAPVCLELGDWYYQKLLKDASAIARPLVLRRAKGYYERFLKLYTKKDAQSFRAAAALAGVRKDLDKLDRDGTLTLNLGKGVTMKLVRIGAGKFATFYMGLTEVTQAQYQSVMGKNPSGYKAPRNPVERVSWDDANAFCEALSKNTWRSVRLPTAAEWKFACLAGAKSCFSFGNDDKDLPAHGWCKDNSGGKPHTVGGKRPNAFGLHDMHGNVWEWCSGLYDKNAKLDPRQAADGRERVVGGGSWFDTPGRCRATYRGRYAPSKRYTHLGFRVVVESASDRK